jgi:hypothetical protein
MELFCKKRYSRFSIDSNRMIPTTKQPPNPTLKNDLLLRAARGEEVERPPVWLMRQAGRILPEYRAVRAAMGGFKDLVETPARASEVTIQPVDLLGVDAAIIFSDILVVPEAMGLPYELVEKVGPRFPEVVRNATDLDRLRKDVDPQVHLNYVLEAIRITKLDLQNRVPLIGFCGAPWTIFCYMVEGKGSKDWALPRRMLWEQPAFAHALLDAITDTSIAYLEAQVDAGVDLVQIFDSWARGVYDATSSEDMRCIEPVGAGHDVRQRRRTFVASIGGFVMPDAWLGLANGSTKSTQHGWRRKVTPRKPGPLHTLCCTRSDSEKNVGDALRFWGAAPHR